MATQLDSKIQCDIMISYHHSDLDFAKKIAVVFEEQGWKVWFSSPDMDNRQMVNQKGEAILGCKIFVSIISEKSAKDVPCQDELALAYISNSVIFPIGLKKFRDISPLLEGGTKLMLAKINWTFFFKDEHFEQNMPALLGSMHKELEKMKSEEAPETFLDGVVHFHGMNINVHHSSATEDVNSDEEPDEAGSPFKKKLGSQKTTVSLSYDFWDCAFKNKNEVTWVDFKKKFETEYKEKVVEKYSEEEWKLFLNLIYKDIFMINKSIKREAYDEFCGGNPDADPHRFYHRMEKYATGYHALREVFNMDSTLRLITIQKLEILKFCIQKLEQSATNIFPSPSYIVIGEFCFPAVISGLTDMLKDEDPNIRAIATIALAKSGRAQKTTVDKIISMLEDEDRLVRESACLALGSLKAGGKSEQAVADRWRNDPIKSVREAAEMALKRMGGDLSKRCIRVTEVLSSEMQFLKTPLA